MWIYPLIRSFPLPLICPLPKPEVRPGEARLLSVTGLPRGVSYNDAGVSFCICAGFS